VGGGTAGGEKNSDRKNDEKNNEIYHYRENIFGNFTDYAVKKYIAAPLLV
jgi:hypothetical protein